MNPPLTKAEPTDNLLGIEEILPTEPISYKKAT